MCLVWVDQQVNFDKSQAWRYMCRPPRPTTESQMSQQIWGWNIGNPQNDTHSGQNQEPARLFRESDFCFDIFLLLAWAGGCWECEASPNLPLASSRGGSRLWTASEFLEYPCRFNKHVPCWAWKTFLKRSENSNVFNGVEERNSSLDSLDHSVC